MRYNISGSDKDTGESIEMTVEAADLNAAQALATRRGIVKARVIEAAIVERAPSNPPPYQPPLEQGHVRGAPVINIAPPRRGNSLGIASLVLGILGFLICWIPFVNLLGVPLTGLGLLLGLIGLLVAFTRKGASIGFPIAGMAVCGLSLFVAITMTKAVSNAFNTAGDRLVADGKRRQETNQTQVIPGNGQLPAPSSGSSAPDLRPTVALLPVNVDARVLVINDIRRPWGETVTKKVGSLMTRLSGAGITTVGEGPSAEAPDQAEDAELAATARLVLDGTQTPVDANEAPAKFKKWFEEKQPDVDAVLWIAPPLGNDEPRFYVFTGEAKAEKAEAVKQVTMARSVKGSRDGPKGAAVEWASAENPVKQGDVQVRITSVKVGKIKTHNDISDREGTSKESLLAISLEITNLSATKKLDYRDWNEDVYLAADAPKVSDNFDNKYTHVTFGLSSKPKGATGSGSVYPGKSIADLLVFEEPVAKAEYLNLELPAKQIGGTGVLRLRIPAAMIQR